MKVRVTVYGESPGEETVQDDGIFEAGDLITAKRLGMIWVRNLLEKWDAEREAGREVEYKIHFRKVFE